MASITKRPNGHRWIQFFDPNKKRQTIRLGKVSQKHAEAVKHHVHELAVSKITGHSVATNTANWLTTVGDDLIDKLVAVGLTEPRESPIDSVETLGTFIDRYISERTDTAKLTKTKYREGKRELVDFFKTDQKPIADVTTYDAKHFKRWMMSEARVKESSAKDAIALAENTARKHLATAKEFFGAAMEQRIIDQNPFSKMAATTLRNEDREFFITREMTKKVLENCPDRDWKLIIGLCRYGGLRCPSEVLRVQWSDVDWENRRLVVHDQKNQRYEQKRIRIIPIFPELMPLLEDSFNHAADGSKFAITRYRDTESNMRTTFEKIITRAGLEPWPRLFQNMRSTRETELVEDFPIHVVVKWIGNSEPIAMKHYLQTTDEHFARAINGSDQPEAKGEAATSRTASHQPEARNLSA